MASRSKSTTESPRRDDAQRGYEEHVQSTTAGAAPEVQQVFGSFHFGGAVGGGLDGRLCMGVVSCCRSCIFVLGGRPACWPSLPNLPSAAHSRHAQAVVAGAHEQSMAAAEEASKALHSGAVPKDTPGMGDAVGACLFQCCRPAARTLAHAQW